MTKRINSKITMLLHSEAKVDFYKRYLERYLRILYQAPKIEEINIFDVFCGTGVYDNNKKGSPLVAFDAIKLLREKYGFKKRISLTVNDSKSSNINAVQNYIERRNDGDCEVSYHNDDADDMFKKIISLFNTQGENIRNLVFIDPYGYKKIEKETLLGLLKNQLSEIILFLPISQMQRFTSAAIESDQKPYEPLKQFVYGFFPEDHPIRKETVSRIEYIEYLKVALRFNEYFSTSFYIMRDKSNYYALFFVSPHIYGFEKILEVKWQIDEEEGGGFKQPNPPSLFEDEEKDLIKKQNYLRLEGILKKQLKTPKNNVEMYKIVLTNEFLPRHVNEVFRDWERTKPNFVVNDCESGKPAKKHSFYISWANFKKGIPRVTFKLEQI